jgi:hypothetical protein
LLTPDAGLPRAVHLVAQGAQALAVDAAGGGERGHALQCRRQGLGQLAPHLADQFVPARQFALGQFVSDLHVCRALAGRRGAASWRGLAQGAQAVGQPCQSV